MVASKGNALNKAQSYSFFDLSVFVRSKGHLVSYFYKYFTTNVVVLNVL